MIERFIFFARVKVPLFGGQLKQSQVDTLELLIGEYERRGMTDTRHLAYIMATTLHECGADMKPVAEWGRGKGKTYGNLDPQTGQRYYGRGFVQLTWKENYEKASKALGIDLVNNPDLAMVPEFAVRILFDGMREGWFAGDSKGRHTLDRYFNANVSDWRGARRIVNGTDKADMIAGYGLRFHAAIEAATALFPDLEPDIKPDIKPVPRPSTGRWAAITALIAAIAAGFWKWLTS